MPQKVAAEKAGRVQRAVSKHILGSVTGWGMCGRKRCRCRCSIVKIVKQSYKTLEELHKDRTETRVSALRATRDRCFQEMDNRCRFPHVKQLLNQRQRQKCLPWVMRIRTGLSFLFSDESFAFHLEIKSKSLEEEWRGTGRKLLKVQWEVSTVSDDSG